MPGGIWNSAGQGAAAGSSMGPWGAAIGAVGGGLASAFQRQPDQYVPQMRIGSQNQMGLYNQLINAARTGQGEYGFGAMVRPGMATLRQQMGNMGHQAGSPVWNSALAQLLSQAGAADMSNRRSFGLQAAQMSPWTYNEYVKV